MNIDEDTLIAYALGVLTPEEEREVVRYLQKNRQAAAQVQAHLEALGAFALSQEPEALPADAEERLLQRIRGGGAAEAARGSLPGEGTRRARPAHKPKGRRPALWLGLAAAAAALVLVWVTVLGPQDPLQQAQRQLEAICADPGAVCETLVDDDGRTVGTLARRPDNSLFVLLEQDPPAAQVYQAWEIVGGTPISRGVYEDRVIDIREPLAAESVFGLTLEPPGGSDQPTSAPFVVVPL